MSGSPRTATGRPLSRFGIAREARWPPSVTPARQSVVGFGDSQEKADIRKHLDQWRKWSHLVKELSYKKEKVGEPQFDTSTGRLRTTQKWRLQNTPQNALLLSAGNWCFPGAIVQSRSLIDQGILKSAQVQDEHRAPLEVTISKLVGESKTVDPPTMGKVMEAIGQIFGDKECPSTDPHFKRIEAYTATEIALEIGVSASYGKCAAEISTRLKRKEKHNSVAVYLREYAFDAKCSLSTPGALFNDDFTEAELRKLVNQKDMGYDNPPLVVSAVHYGRMVLFILTSTATETEIGLALNASYQGFANVDAKVKGEYQNLFKASSLEVIGRGVTADVMSALIQGDHKSLFPQNQPYASYSILGFTALTLTGDLLDGRGDDLRRHQLGRPGLVLLAQGHAQFRQHDPRHQDQGQREGRLLDRARPAAQHRHGPRRERRNAAPSHHRDRHPRPAPGQVDGPLVFPAQGRLAHRPQTTGLVQERRKVLLRRLPP
ncbi:thiol-activated cytolysin family protein [Kitasatospora aureofaciens]|uniref:thiol-activated cytolysin family protein n=1 Tax=Kitasatospora aureofaciens TaxID=1894 RepID=UPI0037C7284C